MIKNIEPLWKVLEVTEFLQAKESWVYGHLNEIPHFKIGGQLRFDPSEIREYLQSKRKGPVAAGPGEKSSNA